MNDLLFSPNPKQRWISAKNYVETEGENLVVEIAERYQEWPRYWWGVANAWLVFLGPSPGNSKAKPIDWSKERLPTLGMPHKHFKTQIDSTGFWSRMREWTVESFRLAGIFVDDNDAALGSVLLANVLETKEGDAGNIETDILKRAIPKVVDNLELVKPRIIVPMEKRVSKLLIDELTTHRNAIIIEGPKETLVKPKNQTFSYYKPKYWQLKMQFGTLLVAESPMHPSKKNFYDAKEVNRYLANKIMFCLEKAG